MVKLSGRFATLWITDDGREILRLAGIKLKEQSPLSAFVQESEDLGLWIRVPREDQIHSFLLFWHYVLAIDVADGLGKIAGLKG